jgi:S-DNA-T family DNA segregation ATPase FtsK/SpoIIIE
VALDERPAGAPARPSRAGGLVQALPDRASLPARPDACLPGPTVALGPGGDDGRAVRIDLALGLLVAGPPGSGRSTALAVIAHGLVQAGLPVVRLVDRGADPLPGVRDLGPGDLVAATDLLADHTVLLVDDLDDLERTHPDLVLPPTTRLVAAVTSASATHAFRGAVPALLRRRRVLVLDAHDPASAELVGPRAAWCVDPLRRPAGRGVLVRGREAVVVQVYSPTP